jgi:RNA polymerase sigma factor (sigma-70 family)
MPHDDAVLRMYREHGDVVLRRARKLLGSDEEAHEALQEIFMSLLSNPRQFDGRSAVTTFLYSVATHHCLNRIRDRKIRLRLLDDNLRPLLAVSEAARAERIAAARQLLQQVPADLALAAVHYYVDEMTQDEIAEVMGCSRRHVGNLIDRLHALVKEREGAA